MQTPMEPRSKGDRMVSSHFKAAAFAEFVAGSLAGADRRELESHLRAGCFSCSAGVEWYRGLSVDLQGDYIEKASESLLESIAKAFRNQATEMVQTVLAQPLFDSFLQPLPVGVRQTMVTERQILYQAGDLQLDLKVEKGNEEQEQTLIGQLIPQDSPSKWPIKTFKVNLRQGKEVVDSTISNPLGEFIFHVVPRKSYDLEINVNEGQKIVLTNVPIAYGLGMAAHA